MTFVKIVNLTMYLAAGWSTKGRITRLDECRRFANERNRGTMLTFQLSDETGSIECISFGSKAPILAKQLQPGKAYSFTEVRLDKKKPEYCTLNSQFQLRLSEATKVTLLEDSEVSQVDDAQQNEIELIAFPELTTAVRESIRLNFMGILKQRDEIDNVTSRTTGADLLKSTLLFENATDDQLTLTVWNAQAKAATTLPLGKAIVVVDVHGELDEDMNLSLTSQNTTVFHVASDCPDGQILEQEFLESDSDAAKRQISVPSSQSLQGPVPFKLVNTIGLAVWLNRATDYFRVAAIVTYFPYPPRFYNRCPVVKCGAKVERRNNGQMQCTKCGGLTKTPTIGLSLVVDIQDYSGSAMITLFNETAAQLLGLSLHAAKTAFELNTSQFNDALAATRFVHYEFRLSVSKDNQGTLSAKCWSVRTLSEAHFLKQLQVVAKETTACVQSATDSLEPT